MLLVLYGLSKRIFSFLQYAALPNCNLTDIYQSTSLVRVKGCCYLKSGFHPAKKFDLLQFVLLNNERPSKMMEKAFYFILKALLIL